MGGSTPPTVGIRNTSLLPTGPVAGLVLVLLAMVLPRPICRAPIQKPTLTSSCSVIGVSNQGWAPEGPVYEHVAAELPTDSKPYGTSNSLYVRKVRYSRI